MLTSLPETPDTHATCPADHQATAPRSGLPSTPNPADLAADPHSCAFPQWTPAYELVNGIPFRLLRHQFVMPLDLHVLSLSLAFILSQDQTLHYYVRSNCLETLSGFQKMKGMF